MITIRKYQDNDYDAVNEILKQAFNVSKAHNQDANNLEYVALKDDDILGYFIIRTCHDIIINKDYAYLEYVCVKEEYQNQGIASEMMRYAISEGKLMHLSYFELTSNYTRKSAHHVYEKLGFVKRDTYVYSLSLVGDKNVSNE